MLFFVYVSYRIELGDISYVIYAAYHCPKVYDKYLIRLGSILEIFLVI